MAATYTTNDQILSVTTKRTVPDIQQVLTGTWTAGAGIKYIIGVGGNAFAICGGDQGVGSPTTVSSGWLLDYTNSEMRRITQVISNNSIAIESGFTNAQTGATLYFVPASRATAIGVVCSAGGGLVDGIALPAAGFLNYGSDQDSGYNQNPLIVDGSSGTLIISIMYTGSQQ